MAADLAAELLEPSKGAARPGGRFQRLALGLSNLGGNSCLLGRPRCEEQVQLGADFSRRDPWRDLLRQTDGRTRQRPESFRRVGLIRYATDLGGACGKESSNSAS